MWPKSQGSRNWERIAGTAEKPVTLSAAMLISLSLFFFFRSVETLLNYMSLLCMLPYGDIQ